MPAYIEITEEQTDPGAPGTSELWKQWRDNPIAIANGEEDAPRVSLSAIERLVAGNQVRSRFDEEQQGAGVGYSFSFMQQGFIRVSFDHRADPGAGGSTEIRRTRNGITSTTDTFTNTTSYVSRSVDVSVLPGDSVYVENTKNDFVNPAVNVYIKNIRFKTAGQNLWPGNSAKLEGNIFL